MARRDVKLEHLGRTWLFSGCNKKELGLIGRASDEVEVDAGRLLCEEGKPGFEFFLILDGRAGVSRGGRKVATLRPGQYFGELSLLDRKPRSATITSETPMQLLVLDQRQFDGLMDQVPGIAHKLLTAMAERLREADAKALN
ncbi:MAG TPA: cyclic nucleotide-binding domain-containing protein [Acidimicrobiales bacterium]|jgi:CRP-like cAMP-binding protein|nr:cyclic nucleotide-binding domain-containing protein [Acidimicrobiales bacterium]